MFEEIRKRAPTPRLLVKRPLIERQRDIGGISINLDRKKIGCHFLGRVGGRGFGGMEN